MRHDDPEFAPIDPGRVHSADPVELRWWAIQLDCSVEQLQVVIAEVGEHVTEIRGALARRAPPAPRGGRRAQGPGR